MIKVYQRETCQWANEEQTKTCMKLDWVCELWGASTKHPDSEFHFSDFRKSEFIPEEHQIFQWLLECASKLSFPFFAKELTEYALENWCTWEK